MGPHLGEIGLPGIVQARIVVVEKRFEKLGQ